jgi:PAS domain S-box-containing protein
MRFISEFLNKWKGNIRLRHTVGLFVIIVLIMGIASGLMLYEQRKTIRKAAEDRGLAFSRTFALMGATAVLNNLYLIQETIGQYLQDPDILEIDVIDPDNMIVTAKDISRIGTVLKTEDWLAPVQSRTEFIASRSDANGQPILVIIEPLFDQGKIAAWVRVIMSLAPAHREELQTVGRLTLVAIALIVAGMLGVHFAQRQISRIFQGVAEQLQGALMTLGGASVAEPTASAGEGAVHHTPQPTQGEIEHLARVVTEATEHLQTQSTALRESETKYRSVAQSANDAIVSADNYGMVIAWNKGAQTIFGYDEEEILGKSLTVLMPEMYQEQHQRGLEPMRAGGAGHILGKTIELVGVRKDRTEFPLELSSAMWKTGSGTFYTGIIRDITERKRAEQALQALTVSLEEKVKERTAELEVARDQALVATRLKSEFLASMSHELRTPLNAIIGFSEVLSEKMFGELNTKQEEYILDILSSGQHLLSLINDILDISKVEAGRMELELSTFSVPALLESTLALVRERAKRNGVQLMTEIDPQCGEFTADERKVKQVLLNLLSNAVKFTPRGGQVVLKTSVIDNTMNISVRDTGVGIAQEDQEKVFEEFYQAGGDYSRKREGTGLGLALAKRYVELHGGHIWVESIVGRGSLLTFSLPARAHVEKTVEILGEMPGTHPQAPLALIIEDDPPSAKLLKLYLTEAGFTVEVAHDGEVGFEKAKTLRPAVITLDILMPRVDGWDFLTRVKADSRTTSIPVVVLSIVDERGKGFALGATEYLVKPVDRDDLIRAVRHAVRTSNDEARDITVLAVDDDPLVLELMDAVLGPEHFSVVKAATGREGLDLARQRRPDVIVLDLLMPDLDGFQVLDELKADPKTAHIPIIILTCKALSPEDKQRLNGRVNYLKQKGDFSRAEFVTYLRSLAEHREG